MGNLVADLNATMFKFESGTYAVPSGTSGNWLGLVTNTEISENMNVQEVRYAGTSNRNVGIFIDGPQDYEFTVTMHPQNFRMLGYALGSIVDVSGTTNQHRMSEINSDGSYAYTSGILNPFASFTLIDQKKGVADGKHLIKTLNGCEVNSYSISASEGEVVEVEVGGMGQTLSVGSKTASLTNIADLDNSRPYVWSDVKLHMPSGTSINTAKSINWNVENGLEPKHYMNGSRVIAIAVPLNRDYSTDVTVDATSELADTIYNQYWLGGSTFNAMLALEQSSTKNCFIVMSGCKVTECSTPSPAEGVNEMSFTFKANSVIATGSDAVQRYNPW